MPALPQEFYQRDATTVARDLLGKLLTNQTAAEVTAGQIVETEAYLGSRDPASHAFRGQTPRTAVMFGPAGRAYVYFTYGMHYCFNAVTGPEGVAEAVLIRALEPVEGINLMRQRRGQADIRQLCSGPAKLVQALGITKTDSGVDLATGPLQILDLKSYAPADIMAVPRIGIRQAAHLPLRFLLKGNTFVSKPPPRGV
ncbi:MAG TPA: DNA-3-methyladenine glycosylase [Candidatus Saccharimonadales bacterium]|nr:DNA-3-methyladenine glycosylase [Candidatus Saccharimonadales bacterium]